MKATVLKCSELAVGYREKTILTDISFSLPEGTFTVFVGANGSGKSTLLRTLAGQQPPLAGKVEICGKPIGDYGRRSLAKVRALVDTSRYGGGALTVGEAVAVGRYAFTGWTGLLSKDDKAIVADALGSVGMLSYIDRHLASLSDGERQKVMIARALAQQTPLIILDEPTAFLDVAARLDIMKMLRRLVDGGKTVLLSTHDIAPAVAQADMILAVDPSRHTAVLGDRDVMIADGSLDRTFAASGLRFDASVLDYR